MQNKIIPPKIFLLFRLGTFFYNLIIDDWMARMIGRVVDCSRMPSIVDESAWQRSKCRWVRRHMMSDQFGVDNKRNSATPKTIWDRSQLLRQHCAGWWVCRNVEMKTCLVINTNLSYRQLSNEIDDDFISVRAFTFAFIEMRDSSSGSFEKNNEKSLSFFSLRLDACCHASRAVKRLFLLYPNSSPT